jgi:hypothetical protein
VNHLHWALSGIVESHIRSFQGLSARLASIQDLEKVGQKWAAYAELVTYLRTLEETEDLREEQFLFPIIAAKAEISSGGPLCMFYFGQATQPLERVAKLIGRSLNQTPDSVAPHLREFFKENSHVCIPVSEHIACAALCNQMESILKQDCSTLALTELENLAAVYRDIRKQNFEKEDNCLLPMTMSLLTEEELTILGAALAGAQGQGQGQAAETLLP